MICGERESFALDRHDKRRDDRQRQTGSLMRKSEPFPISDLISTFPPSRSRLVLTTSMPTPRPETSVSFSAVDRPGKKIRADFILIRHAFELFGGDEAFA